MTESRTGGKIGYFCSYVPREIIYAFGRTPVRILPTAAKPAEAEAYLPRNFCSLIKVILATFLEDQADLEGVIHADSCDGLRRLHDVWRYYVNVPALHLLDLPRNNTATGISYFQHALQELVEVLEERLQVRLSPDGLADAIGLYNDQSALLAELEDRWSSGLVSPSRYYELRRRALTQDPLLINETLRSELGTTTQGSCATKPRSRILLVGSLLTNTQLAEAIENHGARVVAEDSCATGREQLTRVDVSSSVDDMLENLARAYLGKPPCPRMRDFAGRTQYLSDLISARQVDGVIAPLYKFCDLFLSEYPVLREWLQAKGIPVLLLEDEGDATLSGQHRTRLEAYLEVLQ